MSSNDQVIGNDYELVEQADFYQKYLPLIEPNLTADDVRVRSTDGLIGDLLLEFKPSITDLNAVLFQSLRYLSKFRIDGQALPNNILLISYDDQTAYHFKAKPYLSTIEQVYTGSASKGTHGKLVAGKPVSKWQYGKNQLDEASMIKLMKDAYQRDLDDNQEWCPVHIDSDDIIGWATTYYRENNGARKADFLGDDSITGEIRDPRKLKGRILPYHGTDNEAFKYIMDKLNDYVERADLGAFYTPVPYAEKSNELVYDAIRRAQNDPNTDDYVIIDRCAGTGNLESSLNDNVPDDILDKDVLSHCIINTYEYFEYKVLKQRLGSKVRYLIPPTAKFTDGTVEGSNALSKDFLDNPIVNSYLNNDKVNVIIYENPPFAETTSIEHQKRGTGKSSSKKWKQNYVTMQAKRELKGAKSNDMSNVFIWSAFKYYLRKPSDSAVIFSPLKYWKLGDDWFNHQAGKALAFNRKYFHASTASVVASILWKNIPAKVTDNGGEHLALIPYDIENAKAPNYDTGTIKQLNVKLVTSRVHKHYSDVYYEELDEPNDISQYAEKPYPLNPNAIWSAFDGTEARDKNLRIKAKYNSNIIAYLDAHAATYENVGAKNHLLRNTEYDGHGFHLRSYNYLTKLPIFAAGWYQGYDKDWYHNSLYYRSGDGADKFNYDVKAGKLDHWLNQVLFYTCLENYNKIRSLHGSDGRWYYNELCLDNNKGQVDDPNDKSDNVTLASQQLSSFLKNLDDDEQTMYNLWLKILDEAKATASYDKRKNYGIYQINDELNTSHKVKTARGREKKVYDYPALNGDLLTMRGLIKDYYHSHIQDNLFKYEFIK